MRKTLLAIACWCLAACASEPERARLFEPCSTDADCDTRWRCVPGISGPGGPRFCSEECSSGPECLYVRDGERDANYCLPYPGETVDGACFQTCPDEGSSPDDGCEAFGVTSRRWLGSFDIEYCICSP